jgi:hypothetical protein
MKLSD